MSPALTPSRGSTPAGNGWILHLQRATNKFCRKPELGDKISRWINREIWARLCWQIRKVCGQQQQQQSLQALFGMEQHGKIQPRAVSNVLISRLSIYSQLLDFKTSLIFLYRLIWNFTVVKLNFYCLFTKHNWRISQG